MRSVGKQTGRTGSHTANANHAHVLIIMLTLLRKRGKRRVRGRQRASTHLSKLMFAKTSEHPARRPGVVGTRQTHEMPPVRSWEENYLVQSVKVSPTVTGRGTIGS